jgi:hypothetical protein
LDTDESCEQCVSWCSGESGVAALPLTKPNRDGSTLSNVKILITLSYGKGCIRTEEFMAEDLGEEDIVGLVFGFEPVATDGAVGAAEVAGFLGQVEGAEGGGNVLGELGAGGGVDGNAGKE